MQSSGDGSFFILGGRNFLRYWRFDTTSDQLLQSQEANSAAFPDFRKQSTMFQHAGEIPELPEGLNENIISIACSNDGVSKARLVAALTKSNKLLILRNFVLESWIELKVVHINKCIL